MKIPPGLTISSASSSPLVCKLKKSLYGLRKASRQWFSKLFEALLSRGYISCKNDYNLFTKHNSGSLVVLDVYVDDILLAGDYTAELLSIKEFLDHQFKIKDLGIVHYFLGLEVSHLPQVYLICQHNYTLDLLNEFNCQDFTPVLTPLDPSIKITLDMNAPVTDPNVYRRIVGKLNFLQHTRPDIAFSIQHLSQFPPKKKPRCPI